MLRRVGPLSIGGILCTAAACGTVAASEVALPPQSGDAYFASASSALNDALGISPNRGRAKNVVLMIGDGFGVSSVTAARIFEGQQRGVDGESNILAFERLPHLALSKTYSHNFQVSDSAATATAITSGVKTRGGVVGLDSSVPFGDCAASVGAETESIFETAEAAGKATGVVTTTAITHATPASVYAHAASRGWESDAAMTDADAPCRDIARQLVEWGFGDGLEVAFGGGRRNFLPETVMDPEQRDVAGARKDGLDLTAAWLQRFGADGAYVWNKEQFDRLDPAGVGHVLGLFDPGHMDYEHDRVSDGAGEPSLAEMTSKALDVLSRDEDGFFLMVEGGRIDHASHAGNAYRMLTDAVAFNEAVKTVLAKVDLGDTLVIVTADHSHTLTIAGYPARGNDILGAVEGPPDWPFEMKASDDKGYTTLGYANGPGAIGEGPRPDPFEDDVLHPDYKQQSAIPLASETHGGEDVAIYAGGPWAHLFQGTVEQNYIYHVIKYASGL